MFVCVGALIQHVIVECLSTRSFPIVAKSSTCFPLYINRILTGGMPSFSCILNFTSRNESSSSTFSVIVAEWIVQLPLLASPVTVEKMVMQPGLMDYCGGTEWGTENDLDRSVAETYRRWQDAIDHAQGMLRMAGCAGDSQRPENVSNKRLLMNRRPAPNSAQFSDGNCSICLGEFGESDGEAVNLPCCRALIHNSCLNQLRERSGRGTELAPNCPTCRESLPRPPEELVDVRSRRLNWGNLPTGLQAEMECVVLLTRLATEQSNEVEIVSEALLALGVFYFEGKGVQKDPFRAFHYLSALSVHCGARSWERGGHCGAGAFGRWMKRLRPS
jgi:hypothetical protein